MIKKLAFGLAVAFLFSACAVHEWPDTVITNLTDRDVTFSFFHTGTFTLAPHNNTDPARSNYVIFETRTHQNIRLPFTYPSRLDPPPPTRIPEVRFVQGSTDGYFRGYFRLLCVYPHGAHRDHPNVNCGKDFCRIIP